MKFSAAFLCIPISLKMQAACRCSRTLSCSAEAGGSERSMRQSWWRPSLSKGAALSVSTSSFSPGHWPHTASGPAPGTAQLQPAPPSWPAASALLPCGGARQPGAPWPGARRGSTRHQRVARVHASCAGFNGTNQGCAVHWHSACCPLARARTRDRCARSPWLARSNAMAASSNLPALYSSWPILDHCSDVLLRVSMLMACGRTQHRGASAVVCMHWVWYVTRVCVFLQARVLCKC